MSEAKLRFPARAIRRELPSDHHELTPVTAPEILSYGTEDRTAIELQLALSELATEARPQTVARHLLPEGVRLEDIEVQVGRAELPGRLGRKLAITITVAVVPEPRPDAGPAGHWVFIPALEHACFVDRTEVIAERVAAELAVLPAALGLDIDGWRRLFAYAPARLEEVIVELSTTPLAEISGRKAMAEAERRRVATATLDQAGRRLEGPHPPPPLVGREALLGELARILDAPARRGVLLVGEEAAGKSALVAAWASGRGKRVIARQIWATSAAELVAGASGLGEWQERVTEVLAAAEVLDAILYFDDFGALFADRPAEGGVDLGAALRRHVVDGRVRVIGELTPVALDRAERRDVSLIGALLRVTVPPTDPDTTVAAGLAWAAHWALTQPHRPQIAPSAVPIAVDLARRYLPYRAFPGKAIRLLEELRVAHDAGRDARGEGPRLGESELYTAFSWSTGIPIALLADDRALPATDVIAALRSRMVGQAAAVRRVADAICVAKARLQPGDKPLASLLFVGPSGVGKTELARSVAAYLFGAPERMVRLDMSEYTDPWAAERLFGGGGGGDGEGRLTAAVRSQPFGVVLLDEIEKAHASVFDLLLQVLGEARLTDGRGRTTYFHNAIIVLTSNLGTRGARGTLGIAPGERDADRDERRNERRFRDAVLGAFRPELVNRLDQIVVFHPLEPAEIARVAELAVARLAERRGLTQGGVVLDVSPRALERIADGGFSPDLGARALRRYIDAAVLAPAARLLAKAGAEGHGGTLTVRAPDEQVARTAGGKLGEEGDPATIAVALWRRSAATGRRMVRSALAVGALRRETERELALPPAQAVRERLGELEATLATATQKTQKKGKQGKPALPGPEIARLSSEHARLGARWAACAACQAELRTAEELCLEALARDVDAIDLIDGAILQRSRFRRELFWLLTAMYAVNTGATLLVHSPDARAAVTAWLRLALQAAKHHGFRGHVHLWGDAPPGWTLPWGPARDLAWLEEHLPSRPVGAALVRVTGAGADLLFGLEEGLHRFHGLAGEAAHVWVDLLEPETDFDDEEWRQLPGPPTPRAARGTPMREVAVAGADRTLVGGEELDVPWQELPARLAEAAALRLLAAHREDQLEALWKWSHPIFQALGTDGAAGDSEEPGA